ncbi:hypothetical protein FFRU_200050 [Fructobacillus fructosus]|uniref:hypothetical protein n=1 Tax=Fructobacillus fructosus TaxID=1631 RepID=UPI0002195289|nr:hypothetical protein [Fructobacillus fructosus]KRN51623.1 hypothetical protein IV71_GL000567 [Fructobacillus fructosus KCTC 3544]CAK1250535.1 unnamed protein product [Fructobacillus fructosus]CAK1251902.1 unnamed protein product [Fructobacillus fructosus]CAK1252153.1 unnamed protein product [Fructobacillus fructosus]GAP01975.1 hypothetical protein FFRU_200050 [Fructobacillus fructosus]
MAKTNTQVSPPDWLTQKEFQEFKTEVNQNFKQIENRFAMINNRQQWAWNITILIALITLVITMHH